MLEIEAEAMGFQALHVELNCSNNFNKTNGRSFEAKKESFEYRFHFLLV